MKLEKYLLKLEQIDQLIRLKNTGTPEALAKRVKLSRSTLYRYLDYMKDIGAPITYDITKESFVYEYPVKFQWGFITFGLSEDFQRNTYGGFHGQNKISSKIFLSVSNFETGALYL